MGYIRIDRLNEDHDFKIPKELLIMSVGDMLDRAGDLDTAGDAEYEIIEDALIAISKQMGNGYSKEDTVDYAPADTVEIKDKDDEEVEFTDTDNNDDMPTYDDITGGGNSGKDDIDDFEF